MGQLCLCMNGKEFCRGSLYWNLVWDKALLMYCSV
jgi:hypothetical protein